MMGLRSASSSSSRRETKREVGSWRLEAGKPPWRSRMHCRACLGDVPRCCHGGTLEKPQLPVLSEPTWSVMVSRLCSIPREQEVVFIQTYLGDLEANGTCDQGRPSSRCPQSEDERYSLDSSLM